MPGHGPQIPPPRSSSSATRPHPPTHPHPALLLPTRLRAPGQQRKHPPPQPLPPRQQPHFQVTHQPKQALGRQRQQIHQIQPIPHSFSFLSYQTLYPPQHPQADPRLPLYSVIVYPNRGAFLITTQPVSTTALQSSIIDSLSNSMCTW